EDVEDGELTRYRIVGPDETDAKQGWISIDSPLARAMLKKRIDDELIAELPGGPRSYAIVAVEYPTPEGAIGGTPYRTVFQTPARAPKRCDTRPKRLSHPTGLLRPGRPGAHRAAAAGRLRHRRPPRRTGRARRCP